MALVTITGNAWDHAGQVIPTERMPELWFRPNGAGRSTEANALLAGVEVEASFNPTSGAFSVVLDNSAGLTYRPFMRWLVNPDESAPALRAWGYAEWRFDIAPGPGGGSIGTLPSAGPDALYYFGPLSDPPPPGFRGWWEVQAEPGREDSDDPFIGDVRRVYGG